MLNLRLVLVSSLCLLLGRAAGLGQTTFSTATTLTTASGDHAPLWLNANKHGVSSLDKTSYYHRMALFSPASATAAKPLDWGFGADVVLSRGMESHFFVQQLYAEAQWKKVLLTVGSKERTLETKNDSLSSGGQTLGINAHPVPQVWLGLSDYVAVPLTGGFVSIKGFGAYGRTTDDRWQRDFTHERSRYTQNTLFHSKAAYLRFGKKNLTFELGMEGGCQFGGTSYLMETPERKVAIENGQKPKSFWHALIGGGTDVTDSDYRNAEGNHVGSWVARLKLEKPLWSAAVYLDHVFEDNSMMVHIAHNGYGDHETAYKKVKSRYFFYDFKDMMLGAEVKLKRFPWVNDVVVEFLTTKYQGGPVYHDVTYNIGEHITGRDDYYNHHLFTGWQHWGQVMGNPLFRSPLYNGDGTIEVRDNRFTAWHVAFSGDPVARLHYRLLGTWQRGLGNYYHLLPEPQRNLSLMGEVGLRLNRRASKVRRELHCAVAMDHGKLLGNNYGVQLSYVRYGILKAVRRGEL